MLKYCELQFAKKSLTVLREIFSEADSERQHLGNQTLLRRVFIAVLRPCGRSWCFARTF